jgi:hypothetical protein
MFRSRLYNQKILKKKVNKSDLVKVFEQLVKICNIKNDDKNFIKIKDKVIKDKKNYPIHLEDLKLVRLFIISNEIVVENELADYGLLENPKYLYQQHKKKMNYDIFREYNYFFDKVIFLRASSLKYIDSEIDLNFDFLKKILQKGRSISTIYLETDEDKPSKGKFWKHLLKLKDLSGKDVRLSFQWHCYNPFTYSSNTIQTNILRKEVKKEIDLLKKLQLKNQNFYRLLFKEEYKGLPENEGTYNHHFMYRIIEQIVPRNSIEVAMYGKKKKIRTWVRFK